MFVMAEKQLPPSNTQCFPLQISLFSNIPSLYLIRTDAAKYSARPSIRLPGLATHAARTGRKAYQCRAGGPQP